MRKINLLSVVIPCHNEEECLSDTHKRLSTILSGLVQDEKCADYELVYVDNGSRDNTLSVLEGIFAGDKQVRVVSLRRDFGYQGSISAGMFYAQGDAVVTIDADLQDPPEKIEEMISFFEQGYDLVLGVRKSRLTDSFIKRFFSQAYYRLIKLIGVEIVYNHGDFRLMGRSLVDEFNNFSERNRFIRAMILKLESRYATVFYERQPREAGRSKFNAKALLSLSLDGITSFSYVPLRLVSLLGIFMCFCALLGIGWVLYIKISTNVIPGWASMLVLILTFSGLQFLVLGIIGEYIGRLYVEVKKRPLFIVRKKYVHEASREGKALI